MENFILGGYTRLTNKGISQLTILNFSKNTTHSRRQIAELNSPTYLCLSQDGRFLFSIIKDQPLSGVIAYQRQTDGSFQEVDRCLTSQVSACHICYREASRSLYLSNYHLGTLDHYHFDDQCQLHHRQTLNHHKRSLLPAQDQSRIHCASLSSDQNWLYVCNLGGDEILSYRIDSLGDLTLKQHLSTPAGSGPRHLVIHHNGKWGYLVNELANTTAFLRIQLDGQLEWVDSYPNILISEKVNQQEASGAAIKLSQDGRFLYVTSRFINQITVYAVNQRTGQLKCIQTIPSHGQIPRDCCLSQTEDYLLVPHQDSEVLSVFKRHPQNGSLHFLYSTIPAPECVCIIADPAASLRKNDD